MKVYKITCSDMDGIFGSYFSKTPEPALNDILESEAGQSVTIDVVEMTEEEYEALPEFEGF